MKPTLHSREVATVPFDVPALAQTGVAVIVSAMATDAWQQVRGRLGRLFGRGRADQEAQALAELDETRTAIEAAATDDAAREAQAELRGQLKARLRQDLQLAEQFDALVKEIAAQLP